MGSYMTPYDNEAMLRLFLDRMLPAKPTAEPINITLPQKISNASTLAPMAFEIFKALERQELTPEQFKILMTSLKEYRENILAIELAKKLSDLEKKRRDAAGARFALNGFIRKESERMILRISS